MSSSTDERATDSPEQSTAGRERSRRRAVRHAGPPVGETEVPKPVVLAKPVDAHTANETGNDATAKAASPEASAADTPKQQRSLKSLLAWGVTAVVIVALVAAAVVLLLDLRSARERDDRRQAFVDTARQTVLNLTTIHPETAKEDVDRIIAGASGQFLEEFQGREDPFVGVVQDANVTTEGEVIEAGVENGTETSISANVLVAARTMVSSKEQPDPSPRDFRMRVTISDVDGKLTASKVEFVP
ncbi:MULTISPECIES: hypothetical protein [unclassified Rhodococcus (in: high G+C Gram-positive bacteria)]|uniref:hypothetical protein n=1 Tax=unclassified Rhodococcus (in: high G+C Gram-positive bacteria) TaxID=192944 RepID=UPI00163ACC76|nr:MULTISPECIES: hypothetical protein [unclassified Rhodococcus (in: high G+C Gram-positive bacteria)]MBC2642278.1 hypothetical protein [Rhodococcus sp. 3A]MBC2892979.1 hypothetical protein [Rhodococcus sp. 4CII]